jgi:NAD(P)-dependent dehydrogenase (short-subunit alcohol dehydrogenase family)
MTAVLDRLFSLRGKAALVTGASGGLGRVLAVALAEAGAAVGVHGSTAAKVDVTRRAVEKAGGQAVALAADLRDTASCGRLVSEAHRALGRLDILLNCAGMNRRKPIHAVTDEDFDTITAVNLRSLFFLCQAAHPLLRAQGGGKIINIGSITSTDGLGGVAVYGATKAAVAQLSRTMALEWARDNIQVNCLAPGFLLTPLTEAGLWGDAHRKQWLLERIPAQRPGQPEDLIGATLLLASNASAYLTGQIINVDGGYLAGASWLREEELA